MVIITDLGQTKSAYIAENISHLPKTLQVLYVVFHNLEPQSAGLVDVKKDLY